MRDILSRRARLTAGAVFLSIVLAPVQARADVTFEYFQGTAFNLPLPLTIDQAGYPPITFTAHYDVKPFRQRFYYDARIGFWREDAGWVVELLHHKLFLENTTPEVEDFEVTHGYNLITLNRALRRGPYTFLFGGGAVVTYPHSTIRGQTYSQDSPYSLSGVAVQGAAARRIPLATWLFANVEGKLTAAWARVPIANGRATTPNVAFHALAGVGVQF